MPRVIPLASTHHTIVFSSDSRNTALLAIVAPIQVFFGQNAVDERLDAMVHYIRTPSELGHSIVANDLAEVAASLEGDAGQCAGRADAGTGPHGDRVTSVVHMRNVMCGGLKEHERKM